MIIENNADLNVEYSDRTSVARTNSAFSALRPSRSAARPESPISVELKHQKVNRDFGNA